MRPSISLLPFAMLPALVMAKDTPPAPKLAVKGDIRVLQLGKDPIVLSAKRPEMASRANMWTREKFWRLIVSATQPMIPAGELAFTAAIDPNDLPGGGFYVCSLKKDDDNYYFNASSDAAGAPKSDFVFVKPNDILATKNADGTFTFKVGKPFKPGIYALYVADNQYVWPFSVK